MLPERGRTERDKMLMMPWLEDCTAMTSLAGRTGHRPCWRLAAVTSDYTVWMATLASLKHTDTLNSADCRTKKAP